MSRLINKIFREDENGIDYLFVNHSDKTYVMPCGDVEQGMDFYMPTTRKGKMYKAAVKRFYKSAGENLETIIKKISIEKSIIDYIEKTFNEKDFKIAFYTGETDSEQNDKVTLKVFNEKTIGYVRIVGSEQTRELQQNEFDNIIYLEKKGIKNIPYVINIEDINKLNARSEKQIEGKFKLSFDQQVVDFVKKLEDRTEVETTYENSDFIKYVTYLKNTETNDTVKRAIDYIEKNKDDLTFAFSHGDFTPWNIRYNNGEIYTFDLEYSNQSMPKYIDLFHFMTQREVLGKRRETGSVIHTYNNKMKKLRLDVDLRLTFICYLVYIISFYKQRTVNESETLKNQYRIWYELLEHFLTSTH